MDHTTLLDTIVSQVATINIFNLTCNYIELILNYKTVILTSHCILHVKTIETSDVISEIETVSLLDYLLVIKK